VIKDAKYPFNIIYSCDFDLRRTEGKERATKDKLSALSGKVREVKVFSSPFENQILKLISVLLVDIVSAINVLIKRPDFFISRGYVGWLPQKVARFLGVTTVRELHADALGESDLLPYQGVKLQLIKALALLSHRIDAGANVRIFNHPDLLSWYRENGNFGESDFHVYNGYSPESVSNLTKSEARQLFGIGANEKIAVFVGAVSKWHGVDFLVALQAELMALGSDIRIVIGGGDASAFDPENLCISYTPMDSAGCFNLIKASDLCLLPVKNNRASPGSPLKLYDYLSNERFVLAQADTNGYSDEVVKYGVGWTVDFSDAKATAEKVVTIFESALPDRFPDCPVTWSHRIDEWLRGLARVRG